MDHTDKQWAIAQRAVSSWLKREGIENNSAGYFAPFDLYTPNGTRIEVKNAKLTKGGVGWNWLFNIHRHGKVNNENVDVYVFRLESNEVLEMYGFNNAIHMVVPAPIEDQIVIISPRSILNQASRWAPCIDNAQIIRDLDHTFKDIGQLLNPRSRGGRAKTCGSRDGTLQITAVSPLKGSITVLD